MPASSAAGAPPDSRFVVSLLFPGSPPTIRRFIVSVWIRETIQGVTRRRSMSHISNEIQERFPPPFAHGDASSTISIKSISFRIATTLQHVPVSTIFRSSPIAMDFVTSSAMHASATFRSLSRFASKFVTNNNFLFSAITRTQPHRSTRGIYGFNAPNDLEFSEAPSPELQHVVWHRLF